MEALPSEYQHIEITRSEKLFIRYILSQDKYGFLLINVNPTMIQNDNMHVLMSQDGIIMFKFLENLEDAPLFPIIMGSYIDVMFKKTVDVISGRLLTNRSITDGAGTLRFPVSIVYVFPKLDRKNVDSILNDETLKKFSEEHCLFKDEMSGLRSRFEQVVGHYLDFSVINVSNEKMEICDNNINSILQRIAPEYTTIRISVVSEEKTKAGADSECLVVTENDAAVKAFRLDTDQINIVNKMVKGEQLILACAGSGKSVLLIAKCFKVAAMNPEKKFMITCRNKNLQSLYTWFIDYAGLRAKNVTCLTFHNLCKRLLMSNGFSAPYGEFDQWVSSAIYYLSNGKIKERFYGIFIDEVQEFSTDWYRFCFNLLENKSSDDHIFVICGDKTQKIQNQQKHGKAPWNAGDGYPNYRGGNKSIRIEKNYRNCIEINEYINRYVAYAKKYLEMIDKNSVMDPDMFLRGKAVNHGGGVEIKTMIQKSNMAEASAVYKSIVHIHDELKIPYDEIAILMNNASYKKHFPGWKDYIYKIEEPLIQILDREGILHCQMYSTDEKWASHYGNEGGVKFIKFDSVLGLDFRAVIVCGLITLGEHDRTKNIKWDLMTDAEVRASAVTSTQDNIRRLYVACTRAKEVLHIIIPESDSIYMKMLQEALV